MIAPMTHRLARRLLRLYPRAWRARYEGEVLALVEQSGLSSWEAIDLARGAIVEHGRSAGVALLTYLSQTRLERMTTQSGLARFGPWPTGALAMALAAVLQVASATIGGALARRWPNVSAVQELAVSAPMWACFLGLFRLSFLRPRQTPVLVHSLAAYEWPPLNRAASWFWKIDRTRPAKPYIPRHSLMRPLEGAAWIGLAVVARVLMGWTSAVGRSGSFPAWNLSFNAGLFIVVVASAAARGRRFGIGGSAQKT